MTGYEEYLKTRSELAFWARHFYAAAFHPMPAQEEFLKTRAKISVLSGGSRAGKTECGAVRMALLANGILGMVYPESGYPDDGRPGTYVVSGLDYKMATKTLRPKLEKVLGKSIYSWQERNQLYRLKNGSKIYLMSEESGEQKYQAFDIDGAWKDEFGDLKSEGVVHEIIRGLVDRNGPLFVTATPTLGASWAGPLWYEPWRDATHEENGAIHYCPKRGHCTANGVTFYFMDMEKNYYLSAEAKADWISRQVTEEQKAVRLKGRFVTLEGLVYATFDPERHVVDSFPIPPEWPKWRALDWGLSAPTCCLWGAVEPATKDRGPRLHIYREVYDVRRGKTIQMTCELIKDAGQGEEYAQTVMDPACWNKDPAPESVGGFFVVADEFARNGVYAERANNEVGASVERIWGYLGAPGADPQIVIHRCCENLIREMRRQRWKTGITGLTQTLGMNFSDKIEQRDSDHAIDALRYMVMAGPLEANPFDYQAQDQFDGDISGNPLGTDPEWVMGPDGVPGLVLHRRKV